MIRRGYRPPPVDPRNLVQPKYEELPDFADTLTSETENTLREWQLSSGRDTHEARANANAVLFMYANEMRDMKKSIAQVAEAVRIKASLAALEEFKKEVIKDTKDTLTVYRTVSISAIGILMMIVMFLIQKVYSH